MSKGKIRGTKEPPVPKRPKPTGYSHITISPSKLVTRGTPLWMRSVKANAMIEEADRYQEAARNDKGQDLCMNVVPLEDGDGFPVRMAKILETDGIVHVEGKPCPNNSLKSSSYCRSCKKALKGKGL